MHASTFLVALAAIGCHAATIPASSSSDAAAAAATHNPLDRRDNYSYFGDWPFSHCGCSNKLNEKDTDNAVNALKEQLKSGPRFGFKSFYSISGSVVAFVCRWRPSNQEPLTLATVEPILPVIAERCGAYIAGTVAGAHPEKDPGFGYGFWVGYMEYREGLDFCQGANSSPARDCPTGLASALSIPPNRPQ
ncbi:hypothetical protein JDV02_000661 [Purpureocillium takamizusanense]|uniref:Uncharacterized protein n=1 Tax=Purpureocillium takamizusanense TaxID=2060973 RepID=A0A9Q8Q783_9HYPO|nr:uncharacterized protein JDV02_000661 [Purpureocillium takamizusanense]UNI13976.1 hypothetical protein JDV02_000661 [Purpureocillium takamizusanense]